ncbi:MAG TPA: AAA family ATPase, partial [Polyangiales bacterium]
FVAPEALSGQSLDGRTDLYALGATLYYALTGYHAYPARSMAQLWDLWRSTPMPPSNAAAGIPEALDRLVMQLMNHDLALRPADAVEVMQRLEAIAGLPADQELHVSRAYLVAPKLVGRDKALRKLRDARDAALAGRTNAVLVTGPEGIGRSRLLDASSLQAKVQGFLSVAIRGDRADTDYALLRALAEELLGSVPEIASRLAQAQGAALATILPRAEGDGGRATRVTGTQRHAAIQAATCAWLQAIARERSLCIVLDDAAQADIPSLAVLASLLRDAQHAPLALVWSASKEERAAPNWPAALVLLERTSSVVALPPVGADDTEELLSAMFGGVPNLPQLAAYVQATAAGNPRDVLQLLQYLVSEDVLKHVGGAWALPAHWTATDLPSSMRHALERRSQQLGEAERRLAFALSVEPRLSFSTEECALLLACGSASERDAAVRACVDVGVIEIVGAGYRLAQLGFIAALARVTPAADQSAQHRRLAQLFQQRGDGFRAAQHLLLAGDQAAGLDLLIATSIENERRTDADMRVYFQTMRALPADWLALFQEGVGLCEAMQRPAKQRDILLSRAGAFIPIANTWGGGDGFALLRARLERLVHDVGL